MNKQRRKQIQALALKLADLQQAATDAKFEAESLRDDEQEAFDAMPESLQNGERGEAIQSAIEQLDAAVEELDSIDSCFGAAFDALENSGA